MTTLHCWSCGAEWPEQHKPGRGDSCPSCTATLRCCYQCEFYDTLAPNECRENQAAPVTDKDKPNFCDWYRPNPAPAPRGKSKAASRTKADDLWKKFTKGK